MDVSESSYVAQVWQESNLVILVTIAVSRLYDLPMYSQYHLVKPFLEKHTTLTEPKYGR